MVTIDTTGVDPAGDVVALESKFDGSRVESDLRACVEAHCRALIAGDVAGIAADVAPEARDAVLDQYARLPRGIATTEIVAYARLGAQRVVKAKLAGRDVTVVIQQRWARAGQGWQLVAADLVASGRVQ
jgi:hypothetical protein